MYISPASPVRPKPNDLDRVFDLAAALAGTDDQVRISHVFRAVRMVRSRDAAAAKLLEQSFLHLQSDVRIQGRFPSLQAHARLDR
jgi:hypothetical protein